MEVPCERPRVQVRVAGVVRRVAQVRDPRPRHRDGEDQECGENRGLAEGAARHRAPCQTNRRAGKCRSRPSFERRRTTISGFRRRAAEGERRLVPGPREVGQARKRGADVRARLAARRLGAADLSVDEEGHVEVLSGDAGPARDAEGFLHDRALSGNVELPVSDASSLHGAPVGVRPESSARATAPESAPQARSSRRRRGRFGPRRRSASRTRGGRTRRRAPATRGRPDAVPGRATNRGRGRRTPGSPRGIDEVVRNRSLQRVLVDALHRRGQKAGDRGDQRLTVVSRPEDRLVQAVIRRADGELDEATLHRVAARNLVASSGSASPARGRGGRRGSRGERTQARTKTIRGAPLGGGDTPRPRSARRILLPQGPRGRGNRSSPRAPGRGSRGREARFEEKPVEDGIDPEGKEEAEDRPEAADDGLAPPTSLRRADSPAGSSRARAEPTSGHARVTCTRTASAKTASARHGSVARKTSFPAIRRWMPLGLAAKSARPPATRAIPSSHARRRGDGGFPSGGGAARARGAVDRISAASGRARRRKPGKSARSGGDGVPVNARQKWLRWSAFSQSFGSAELTPARRRGRAESRTASRPCGTGGRTEGERGPRSRRRARRAARRPGLLPRFRGTVRTAAVRASGTSVRTNQ